VATRRNSRGVAGRAVYNIRQHNLTAWLGIGDNSKYIDMVIEFATVFARQKGNTGAAVEA
jgi:hypothetical protein